MTKKQLYDITLSYLAENCPKLYTELHYENPFQILVAVVLSAQCTDKRVNMVTPKLFEKYPTAALMSQAEPQDILPLIKSISYPNSKSKYLAGLSKHITNDYNGEIPSTIEDLTRLPGVGRKTANVIQAIVFNKATLAVDTHVFRVSHRLGLVSSKCTTPLATEKELLKHIPTSEVSLTHFWLLYHGRYICTARKPSCAKCGLTTICKYFKASPHNRILKQLLFADKFSSNIKRKTVILHQKNNQLNSNKNDN